MNALNVAEYTQTLGVQARAASAVMARADSATRIKALRALAALLRANVAPLQTENAKDLERATAAGLPAPMVDRLKLTPRIIETVAQGCEQLAAMPDIIGEVIGLKQQPSGIRVGQMRVPIGVFGMIFESRPNVTIEAASLSIKSGNACILRGGSEAIESNKALARLVQQALAEAGLPAEAVQLVQTTDREAVGQLIAMPQYVDVIIDGDGQRQDAEVQPLQCDRRVARRARRGQGVSAEDRRGLRGQGRGDAVRLRVQEPVGHG
ncbi:MAG: glutamate-5-semialdehyde dehydrogenase [Ramlibacter sp.]|nr:glutamate-5-semialdehyde dehydrogenase [Ramlibacter sp.]